MATKYTKKEFMENIRTLTSPFENRQNGQRPAVQGLADKIKQLAMRNKGIKEAL